MSDAGPTLHFAMLTYGALAETERAVRTIAATTGQPFVLHVVDNASPDGRTQAWLQAQQQPWLRYRLNQSNRGVPGGRNDLLDFILPETQPHDWIVFVDNDLEFEAGWLQPFAEAMRQFPGARVLGKVGHLITVHETGRELLPAPARTAHVDVVSGGFACFVRADAARTIGRFDEELGQFWHEDDDYCVRAIAAGFDVVAVPEAAVVHHEHASGVATPDLVHGGSRDNLAYLAGKWRAHGYVDSDGWVKREGGPYLPQLVRAEMRRRIGRAVGRSELAAAATLLEQMLEQQDPVRWFDEHRHPIPACTWALLELHREQADQLRDEALSRRFADIAAALQRAGNTPLLRSMVRGGPHREGTIPGQGVCRDADFGSPEFGAAAEALRVRGLVDDPYAHSAQLWEQLAFASHLSRHGVARAGARVLHLGNELGRVADWLTGLGVEVCSDGRAARDRFDAVIFSMVLDTDVIEETLSRHADDDTLVLVLGQTALNGVPTKATPQPLQLDLDLIERTRLRPTARLALAVDDAVLEACVTAPDVAQYPALSSIVGPQVLTSFVFAAHWQPKPKDTCITPALPAVAPTLTVGVDLRTLFYADSTARGIGKFTTQHLAALCEAEPGLRIVGYATQDGAVLPPVLQLPQVTLQQIDGYRPDQVDLVHLPDPMNMSFGFDSPIRTLRHPRVTTTFHDLTPLHRYLDEWPRANREGYLDRLRQLERSDVHLLTNSAFTAQDVLAHTDIPARRVTPILAGLHRDGGRPPSAAEISEVHADLGIRGPFVLHVGAHDPHKNFYCALNAFLMARAKRPLQLVVVGAIDPGTTAAAAFCSKRNVPDVTFTGYLPRKHLNALYASATALLFLSRAEGFGLPILEAMAKGCPVIASGVTSHPEVAGDAALLVDPDDQAGAAAHVLRLLDEPTLGAELRRRGALQAEQFTWRATAERTLAVWQRMAAPRVVSTVP
jgi:alpha-1,3-rhamnosyl/mannosyltransferase